MQAIVFQMNKDNNPKQSKHPTFNIFLIPRALDVEGWVLNVFRFLRLIA